MTQNSQCLVDYARAWEKFGNVPLPFMKWNMPVYFHPSFVGGKDVKVREQSVATPWTSVNALVPWTVPNLTTDPPSGQIATPLENATVSRSQTLTFTGWALDNTLRTETAIQSIKVYMDGEYQGLATLGQPSTACGASPGRPGCPNVGFTFSMLGTSMSVGQHLFEFVVRDSDAPHNLLRVLSRRVTAQ
ncbi:MAG: hypothetical protein JNM66_20300 [Bryobacterales bacterium]|nr:hypothetical protein [Bryobacterales bacterium]